MTRDRTGWRAGQRCYAQLRPAVDSSARAGPPAVREARLTVADRGTCTFDAHAIRPRLKSNKSTQQRRRVADSRHWLGTAPVLTEQCGDPQNPVGNRITGDRCEKDLNVTLNSVVFRSSGQDLTTAGTYVEMASRLMEPTLLALAALAVRGRIKR